MSNFQSIMNDCHRAAVNNEIVRLIWVCYKEQYLRPGDGVSFLGRQGVGNETSIGSLEEAQRVLYDARLKDELAIFAVVNGESLALDDPRELLTLMRPWLQRAFPNMAIDEERWQHWLDVSAHAVRNEAAALEDKTRLDARIAPHGSVLGYAAGLAPNESFAFFCRYAAYFGRFDMPFSKMRLPVANVEAALHAPEFGQAVRLSLAAIERRHLLVNGGDTSVLVDWLERDHPEAYHGWVRSLADAGLDPLRFAPMPVHPVALPLYARSLAEQIAAREVVLETGATISTHAGLSYRTMIPHGEDSRFAIKLPVPLQLTGYVRYIDMEELRCAPQISTRLAQIFADENGFDGRLRLDREFVTAGVVPRNDSVQATRDTPYLACLLRENQGRSLPQGSVTMPLAALFSASSLSGTPVLLEAMEKAGVFGQEQAMSYFTRYLDILLESVLRLFLRHGIMLEAHQQNLGVTLDMAGRLEMLHYHDLACAVFFHRPTYLAAGHPGPTLQGMSNPYASDDAKSSCSQFVHTVLLLNILPVIDIVSEGYDLPKARLLRMTCDAIVGILRSERTSRSAQDGASAVVFEKFHNDFEQYVLAAPTFSSKRLLGRLFAQSQTRSWGEVPNNDPAFAAVRGSSVDILNPLHPFYVREHAGSVAGVARQ